MDSSSSSIDEGLDEQSFDDEDFYDTAVVPADNTNNQNEDDVEEKFEKYFGYLVRCEGKFCTTTLKNWKNLAKIDQNANKMPSKFQNRPLKTIFEIWNRDLKTLNPKP